MKKKYKLNPETRKARNKRYYLEHRKKEVSVKEQKAIWGKEHEEYKKESKEWNNPENWEVFETTKLKNKITFEIKSNPKYKDIERVPEIHREERRNFNKSYEEEIIIGK